MQLLELSEYIKEMGYTPEQVQDFYPTPGSLSTTMYYTGINPFTEEKVYVPNDQKEKNMQRALLQFKIPENYNIVKEALIKAQREDLIGFDKKSLIPPRPIKANTNAKFSRNKNSKVTASKTTSKASSKLLQNCPKTASKPLQKLIQQTIRVKNKKAYMATNSFVAIYAFLILVTYLFNFIKP